MYRIYMYYNEVNTVTGIIKFYIAHFKCIHQMIAKELS